MCGIVGINGRQPICTRLIESLGLMEYRGYDSAGLATIHNGGIDRRRAEGKLCNLTSYLKEEPLEGQIGIAHTRWATHGAATEINAHPHMVDGVAVVHNGIIENFAELSNEFILEGAVFESQTDTEVIAHLLAAYRRQGMAPKEAMFQMLPRLTGSFALVVMFFDAPNELFAARSGPPLAIGFGQGEMFIGSDAIALSPFTNELSYLLDGDFAIVRKDSASIFEFDGTPVSRSRQLSRSTLKTIEKGAYRHFMHKEIYDQPATIQDLLDQSSDDSMAGTAGTFEFKSMSSLIVIGCGTAQIAGLVAKYWFERLAKLPVNIDVASEFRYRQAPFMPSQAALFISQSGETADTIAALRHCTKNGVTTGAVVNVAESTIARDADVVFKIMAGVEIGVASTKAFTCQLTVLALLAIRAGRERGVISQHEATKFVDQLMALPELMQRVLYSLEPQIKGVSEKLSLYRSALFLGRGTSFPLALEGALKLKEVSYLHAEGYPAGELKHGPIALVDKDMPVIIIAPHDQLFEKTISNMQEVAARGGKIILITDETGSTKSPLPTLATIVLPDVGEIISPMIFSVPLQLLAYHTAAALGRHIDQPRNLAKSVTVE